MTFVPEDQVISDELRLQPQQDQFLIDADNGRRLGRRDAPWRLEVVLSMHCQSCRHRWPALRDNLQPWVANGTLEWSYGIAGSAMIPNSKNSWWCCGWRRRSQQHGPWLIRALGSAHNNEALMPELQRQEGLHLSQQQMVAPAIERLLRLEQHWLAATSSTQWTGTSWRPLSPRHAKPVATFSRSWGLHEVLQYIQPAEER